MSGRNVSIQRLKSHLQPSPRSFSQSTVLSQPVFRLEGGQGIERSHLGRRTLDKINRYKALPESNDAGSALVTADRHFGARVVRLASSNGNMLDLALVRAVRKHLERLEENPSVTIVIIQGQTDGVFSGGTDMTRLQALARGEGRYTGASADARVVALQHLQEQYRLHHLIATYSKPIVAGMTGTVQGSAWALGQHCAYTYVADNTSLNMPEVSQGLVPHGGASYHLARIPDGVGMWAAMTGAITVGETAYWSGLSPLYGSSQDVRDTLVTECGDVSADTACGTDLQRDPVYIKAMAAVRAYRGDGSTVEGDEEDDLSAEMYDDFFRLKRWYQQWASGDADGANAILDDREVSITESLSIGDHFDAYRGADSRRQLHPSRFGSEHHGSYDNEPAAAAAERRARMGAVSAHAAALFKGTLGAGPAPETAAQLGVVRRCFGSGPRDPTVLIASALAPIDAHAAHAAAVEAVTVRARSAAAARGERNASLDKQGWMERLPAAPGRAGLRAYLLKTLQKTCLVPDAHLTEMKLHIAEAEQAAVVAAGGKADPSSVHLRLLSPALPPVRLDATIEMIRYSVEAAWPAGQMTPGQWRSIAGDVMGLTATGLVNIPLVAGVPVETLEAHLRSTVELTVALVTASLHGVDEWSLANPAELEGLQESASCAVAASTLPVKSSILGPNSYTIPDIPKVMVDDEKGSAVGVLPVNPRLFSDPDGMFGVLNEEDDDLWWPFAQGSWMGDVDGLGDRDAAPIFPSNAMGLRLKPELRPDPVGLAVDVLRTDVIRLLHVSFGSVHEYTQAAASQAAAALNAEQGNTAAASAVRDAQAALLGQSGQKQLDAILARYDHEEGLAGDDMDVERPGSRRSRALMHLAWPAMRSALKRMRALVYTGMADGVQGGFALSPSDAEALADAAVDTLSGRLAMARKGEKTGSPEQGRLLRLYASLVHASTPKARTGSASTTSTKSRGTDDPASGALGLKDPAGDDLPAALPCVILPEAAKAELRACAAKFVAWEAAALGRRAGGDWVVLNARAAPESSSKYTLGWVMERESGAKRLTLQRKVASEATVKVTPSPSPSTSTATTSISRGAPQPSIPISPLGGAGKRFNNVGEVRDFFSAQIDQAQKRLASEGLESVGWSRGSGRDSGLEGVGSASLPSLPSPGARYSNAVADPVEEETKEVMEGALPDGNLPYRQDTLEDPIATSAARGVGLVWDWDVVRTALTDSTGQGVIDLFALPETGRTLGAGAMVSDYFRGEADGRIAPPLARSVEEIFDRLAQEAAGRSVRGGADGGERSSAFAADTLKQLGAAPAGALRATHALLLRASTASLADAMAMEYRAMVRLMGLGRGAAGDRKGDVSHGGKSYSARDAGIDTSTLFDPLPKMLELNLEESGATGFSRVRALAKRARAEKAQARWEAALEEYLANGEAGGAIGDMFRRKFRYMAPSVTGAVGADPAEDDEDTLNGTIGKYLDEDVEARRVAGQPDPVTEAEEAIKADEDYTQYPPNPSTGGDEDEEEPVLVDLDRDSDEYETALNTETGNAWLQSSMLRMVRVQMGSLEEASKAAAVRAQAHAESLSGSQRAALLGSLKRGGREALAGDLTQAEKAAYAGLARPVRPAAIRAGTGSPEGRGQPSSGRPGVPKPPAWLQ